MIFPFNKGQTVKMNCLSNNQTYEIISFNKTNVTIKIGSLELVTHISRIYIPNQINYLIEKQEIKKTIKQHKSIKESKPIPFDVNKWAEENGGIHLIKKSKFGHAGYVLSSHIVIDEPNGFFHTINIYKYPDGTISRGKRNSGGNKYPLKGFDLNIDIEENKHRTIKGSKTAVEVYNEKIKDGYELSENSKILTSSN